MSDSTLPVRPSLEHLKSQARDLLTAAHAASPDAVARVRSYFPADSDLGLNEAQLIIAREYGFPSWAKLKREVELRLANPDIRERAKVLVETAVRRGEENAVRALLQNSPELSGVSAAAACVAGNADALRDFLDADPALLNAKIAPKDWEPLLYVCYSSLLKDPEYRPRLIDTARILIDRGANVNAAWYEPEWTSWEACLYGATGVNDCPELAEMLLKAGADPNDDESMYHSTELPTIDCLKLLLDYGCRLSNHNGVAHLLDRDKPDWLRVVVSYATDTNRFPPVIPFAMRRGRSTECLRILIEGGVDLNAPDPRQGDRTPYQAATRLGRVDVMEMLEKAGADTTLTAADALIGRLSRGEHVDSAEFSREMIAELDAEKPTPTLVVLAERGNENAIATLLSAGANPDVVDANEWTPLHVAAMHGSVSIVRILIAGGANPKLRVSMYNAEPIGFACHGSENQRGASADDYVRVVEALLDAGGELPATAWGSPEVKAMLVARGAKPG